ncbi:diacylglycerol kinase [Raineyella antarctica]|uniref:Diacylglycerol kinase n=1 Tax=Raineyella antarctica TaxID=1577474 RepID=A0A1G6GRQ8_9ACTN|nr:YegS/Rv2252/BmrU family lipid kinase [Raineyella antarctica]SDB84654.1 diacylglycerol kinase [Raineyella antarctica]
MTDERCVLSLVVNPSAGLGRARKLLPKVVTELVTSLPGVDLRVHLAETFAEAQARCARAVAEARPAEGDRRADALLVMGGDGMMHLGANACAGTTTPLGLIPAGTGNDSCRGLGLPPANPVAAARLVVRGGTRRIDLAKVTGALVGGVGADGLEHVVSIVSTGFDALVNLRANHTTFPRGRLRYAWSATVQLARFEPLPYRLVIDGEAREFPAILVAVGNAGYAGGGMAMCPSADVTDGLLDLTIVHPVSRATFLRLLPSLFNGTFVRDPAVEQLRAREVRVDGEGLYGMADGEELGPVPLVIEVEPQALTIFTPTVRQLSRPPLRLPRRS